MEPHPHFLIVATNGDLRSDEDDHFQTQQMAENAAATILARNPAIQITVYQAVSSFKNIPCKTSLKPATTTR